MPTLVAAFTLVGLLRMAHVDMPRWHMACWFAVLVGAALRLNGLAMGAAALNAAGSFGASWLYFWLLAHTDTRADREAHYLILVGGMTLLIGSRLWIDVSHYAIGL